VRRSRNLRICWYLATWYLQSSYLPIKRPGPPLPQQHLDTPRYRRPQSRATAIRHSGLWSSVFTLSSSPRPRNHLGTQDHHQANSEERLYYHFWTFSRLLAAFKFKIACHAYRGPPDVDRLLTPLKDPTLRLATRTADDESDHHIKFTSSSSPLGCR
jgi:hypothetical protein